MMMMMMWLFCRLFRRLISFVFPCHISVRWILSFQPVYKCFLTVWVVLGFPPSLKNTSAFTEPCGQLSVVFLKAHRWPYPIRLFCLNLSWYDRFVLYTLSLLVKYLCVLHFTVFCTWFLPIDVSAELYVLRLDWLGDMRQYLYWGDRDHCNAVTLLL